MGRGTKGFDKAPPKRKLYGDGEFHLRPIYLQTDADGKETYGFFIRPSEYQKDKIMIEGEFGMGEASFQSEKSEAHRGTYKNTKYFYYDFDYNEATPKQQKIMKRWAINGEI